MRILLVAATEGEISALQPDLKPDVDVLVTGIGMVATAARCARALALTRYDLALNVGICGSFGVGRDFGLEGRHGAARQFLIVYALFVHFGRDGTPDVYAPTR